MLFWPNDLDRPISGKDLSDHLFGDIYELGERVLERSVSIGLLEWSEGSNDLWRSAHLSQAGKKAIEQEKVLISEEGVWRFYYLDDPLIRDRLIHLKHLNVPEAWKVRKAWKERRNLPQGLRQPDNSVPTPDFLKRHQESTFTSVVDDTPFMLQDISKEGENLSSETLNLDVKILPDSRLDITLTSPSCRGSSLQVNRNFDPPEDLSSVTYEKVWKILATQGSGVEPRKYGADLVVPVHFDEIDDAARNSMRKDIQVPNPGPEQFRIGLF